MTSATTIIDARPGTCSAGLLAGLVVSSGADVELPSARGGHCCAWTAADEAALDQLEAGAATVGEVARLLGRTECAVSAHLVHRKRNAGQTHQRRPWTPEEDARCFALHAEGHDCEEIAAELHRSPEAVEKRLDCGLGGSGLDADELQALPLRRPWTEAEDDFLAERYGKGAPAQLPANLLALALHRPEASIHRRAAIIGLAPLVPETQTPEPGPVQPLEGAPWTKAEDAELRRSWRRDEPVSEIALALHRPASEIRARASRLHLRTPKKAPAAGSRSGAWWTSSEDQTIRTDYGRLGPARLARLFGRTRAEVEARARIVTHPGAYGRAYQPDANDEDVLKGII